MKSDEAMVQLSSPHSTLWSQSHWVCTNVTSTQQLLLQSRGRQDQMSLHRGVGTQPPLDTVRLFLREKWVSQLKAGMVPVMNMDSLLSLLEQTHRQDIHSTRFSRSFCRRLCLTPWTTQNNIFLTKFKKQNDPRSSLELAQGPFPYPFL